MVAVLRTKSRDISAPRHHSHPPEWATLSNCRTEEEAIIKLGPTIENLHGGSVGWSAVLSILSVGNKQLPRRAKKQAILSPKVGVWAKLGGPAR